MSEPKMRRLVLGPDKRVLLCEMSNGKNYEMSISELSIAESWDDSEPSDVRITDDGWGGEVTLASGAVIDFSSDIVLYACEPMYEYYSCGKKIRRHSMKKLAQEVEKASHLEGEFHERLRSAGKAWARAALDCFTGNALHKALAISEALAEFANEIGNEKGN